MKIRSLRSIYYPLTIPRPKRLRRWVRKVPYTRAEIVAAGEVSAVRYRLPAATPEIAGKRIAFASDFHYGGSAHDRFLAEQAAEHIRTFRPDVLCLGGDLAADAIELTRLPELLETLRNGAPLRLAILGNWEHGKSWLTPTYWENLYASSGIRLLRNAGTEYRGFYFYGSDELTGGNPRLPERWPDGLYPVLLAHRPDTAIALDSLRALDPIGLILCGHTHGGQLRFPLLGALYAASNYGCKLDYGLFERRGAGTRMIVSSGVGNRSLGFRFRCRREVVLIEFV